MDNILIFLGKVNKYLKTGKTIKGYFNGMAFKGSWVQIPSAPPNFGNKYGKLPTRTRTCLFYYLVDVQITCRIQNNLSIFDHQYVCGEGNAAMIGGEIAKYSSTDPGRRLKVKWGYGRLPSFIAIFSLIISRFVCKIIEVFSDLGSQ